MITRLPENTTTKEKAIAVPKNSIHIIALLCAILILMTVFAITTLPVHAQTSDFPEPLQPANNATDVSVTNITFTWSPYYVGTEQYTLQIATDTEFNETDIVFETVIAGTTYVYKAIALSYDTTYWWRVMASKPLGGTWSPLHRFITKTNTPAPAPQPEQSDSFFSSIKDFFTEADPLLIGLIVAGIIVIVLAIYVVFLQPASKKSAARSQQAPPPPAGGAAPPSGARCPQCGSPNTPGRKFCGICGANLSPAPPPPPPPPPPSWGAQQRPAANTCPSCGSPNPPGRAFCGSCGGSMAPAPEPPAQPAWNAQQERFCTSCGTKNAAGKKFCGTCGASLEAGPPQQQIQIGESYTCPVCGGPIAPGTNPCTSCGTWLDWS